MAEDRKIVIFCSASSDIDPAYNVAAEEFVRAAVAKGYTIVSGVPSIISRQSGAAEVLKYAFKVDFWDVDAMADEIYALLQYPALAEFAKIIR